MQQTLAEVSFKRCYSEQPGGACTVSLCLTRDINYLLACQGLSGELDELLGQCLCL